jgi:zinc protease
MRMSSFLRAVIAALLLVSLAVPMASPQARAQSVSAPPTPSQATQAQVRTLANGLRVVVVEDPSAPVVQTGIWYRFGSLYETPGKTGLAHALEHMSFRGTPSLSSGGLTDFVARLGIQENAETSNDYTHFYFVLPADRLEAAIRIEADRMHNLLLSQSDWNLEKGAVLTEIDTDFSSPPGKLYYTVRRAAFPHSDYGLTALGERADVVRSTAADLRRYYDEWYAPNNATFVVTGDIRAADVFAMAQKYFGPVARKTLPASRPGSAPAAARNQQVNMSGDYPYGIVMLAYQMPGDLDPAAPAPNILPSVINNQRSPFFKALVESGITLGYNAFADTQLRGGLFYVQLVVAPGSSPQKAIAAFTTTLAQVERDGIAPDLVDAAKKSVAVQAIYARDSIAGLGDRFGNAYGVEQRSPGVDDARIASVTVADANAALKKYLAARSVTGILTPRVVKPGQHGSLSTSGGVSESFASRAPSGPIVQPDYIKAALAKPVDQQSKVDPKVFTLANGLRVLVQEVHTNPTVFINGVIDTSPAFDPQGKEGLGGLTSALAGYGSEKYNFNALGELQDRLAANVDLGMNFDAHGLSSDFDTLVDVLDDGERHPAFPESYVTLVKSQEQAAVSQRAHNPDYLAGRAYLKLMLPPGDPSLREETTASLGAIAAADMHTYVSRYYRPDLTLIAVVGDVDAKHVVDKLTATFGTWVTEGPKPDVAQSPIPLRPAASAYVPANRSAVTARLGQTGIARSNPDFYALNLMNEILGAGGSFDTRLMDEIRSKRGLVYGVSSSLNVNRWRGTIDFSLTAAPSRVRPAVALLKAQLARIQTQPVSGGELVRAKSKIIAGALVAEQATQTISERLENIGINQLPANYYATLGTRYNPIGAADIQRVARTYLHPKNLIEVYEGPRF